MTAPVPFDMRDLMLRIDNITYSVEGRPLMEEATIPTGHKVGVVGRNGTGKSTLFRLIRGELALETGSITVSYTHLTLPTNREV